MDTATKHMHLQAVGKHGHPLDPNWITTNDELLRHVWSTPKPQSWEEGDLVVYYASGYGKIVAIMGAPGMDVGRVASESTA